MIEFLAGACLGFVGGMFAAALLSANSRSGGKGK